MSDNSDDVIPREELLALHNRFREVKHGINNALAVIMALSEMTQRKPEHAEKLCRTVLNKAPQIVEDLQSFARDFRAIVKPPADDGPIGGY